MQISRQAHNYSYVHIISNFVLLTFFKPLDPSVKRQIYSYIETINNYGHIISNSVEITRYRPSLYTKKTGSTYKPAHAHLRRFNTIGNNLIREHNCIMYF